LVLTTFIIKDVLRDREKDVASGMENAQRDFDCKRPVNPILNLGVGRLEVGAWKTIQSEKCGYGVVEKR
jgi:hypothetical protein